MKKQIFYTVLLFFVGFGYVAAQDKYPFENEIKAFQKMDSVKMPDQGGILFTGSSSIRKWTDLEQRFSDKPIIKRGVGGSTMWQMVDYYLPTIVYPYKPEKIFLYEGENDMASGWSVPGTFEKFREFYYKVQNTLPGTEIYFLSMKHSPSRTKVSDNVTTLNALVKDFSKRNKHITYVDVDTPILDKKGEMRPELFQKDLLHLKPEGYDYWEKAIRPYL